MPLHRFYQKGSGPIEGLRLPKNAWEALESENITTIEELRAVIDRIEEVPGIGPKTAQVIRTELARKTSPKQ